MSAEPGSAWKIVTGPEHPAAPPPDDEPALPAPIPIVRAPDTRRGLPRVSPIAARPAGPRADAPDAPSEPRTRPPHLRVVPGRPPSNEATLSFDVSELRPRSGQRVTTSPTVHAIAPPAEPAPPATPAQRAATSPALHLVPPPDPRQAPIARADQSGLIDLDLTRVRRDDDPLRQSAILELSGLERRPWGAWLGVGAVLALGGVLAWWLARG